MLLNKDKCIKIFNSFLFVINKIDESNNNNIDLENVKRKIKHILFGENKSLVHIFKIKEKQDISISLFSCLFFKNYLVFYEKIKDFENYIKSIIEEIKIEKEEEEENYDLIDEIKNNINYVLELYYKKINKDKLAQINIEDKEPILLKILMNNGVNEGEFEQKKDILIEIIKVYKYMIKEINMNKEYKDSNMDNFILDLKKTIKNSKRLTENEYQNKIKDFILTLKTTFQILQQNSLLEKSVDIAEIKKKMENKLIEINIIYKKTIESVIQRIDEDFAELLSKIDNIIQKGNINETTVSELKSDLKNFNNLYDKKINLLNEFVKNKYNYLESTIYNIFIESIEEYSKDASFLDTIKRSPLLM